MYTLYEGKKSNIPSVVDLNTKSVYSDMVLGFVSIAI